METICTRLAAKSGVLIIRTRRQVDDPLWRFIERFPYVRVLRYAATAEVTDQFRQEGDALFPEFSPLEFQL